MSKILKLKNPLETISNGFFYDVCSSQKKLNPLFKCQIERSRDLIVYWCFFAVYLALKSVERDEPKHVCQLQNHVFLKIDFRSQ